MGPRDTPRIATSGQLTMGMNPVPPMPPRLEIEKVTALHLVGLERSVARAPREVVERDRRPVMFLRSASRITGTNSPRSVSTATPM